MIHIVAIAYPGERRASEVMEVIKRLHKAGTIDLHDAVAISKDKEGRIKAEEAVSRRRAGAVGGLLIGTLIGLIFFTPVVGALFGTAAGALAGTFADLEHVDDFAIEVADNMPPGSSAILMLVNEADPEPLLEALQPYGGTVIRTTLPADAGARIREALAHSPSSTV